MDLTPATIDRILQIAPPVIFRVGEKEYTDKKIHQICEETASKLNVFSLSSLVDYIKTNPDNILAITDRLILLINVKAHNCVDVLGPLNTNKTRDHYLQAELYNEILLNKYMPLEDFILQLQSSFVNTEMLNTILKFASNLTDEFIKTNKDDGITQTAVIKTGIVKLESVNIPNPVELIPYRTFPEIDQPKGLFILRAQKTPAGPQLGLFDCNANGWKLETISKIKDYLRSKLDGNIII